MGLKNGVYSATKRTFRQVALAVLAYIRLCAIGSALRAGDIIDNLVSDSISFPELKRLSEYFMSQDWGRVELGREEFISAVVLSFDWDARPDLAECLYRAARKRDGEWVDSRIFSIALASRVLQSVQECLSFIFHLFDRHGAGLLDLAEFTDLMVAVTHDGGPCCRLSHVEISRLFEAVDTNHNGFIDRAELLSLVESKPAVIQQILKCASHGIHTLKRGTYLHEEERILLRRGGCLFVYQDALFKSSWVERYCEIARGKLHVYRGKNRQLKDGHIERALQLHNGRLSKIVPESVRLRLETPQEVLLLEAENPQISAAWIKLFHNEGLECSPDPFRGGPISPSPLVEMRKQSEATLSSTSLFYFTSPPARRARPHTADLGKRISMPLLQLPVVEDDLNEWSSLGPRERRNSISSSAGSEEQISQARLAPPIPILTRSRSLTSRQLYQGGRLSSADSDPDVVQP